MCLRLCFTRYLRYCPKEQPGQGIYRVLSDYEEKTLKVAAFAKSDGRVKSGLFIACLATDQRLSESIFESAATGNIAQVRELYSKDTVRHLPPLRSTPPCAIFRLARTHFLYIWQSHSPFALTFYRTQISSLTIW